MADDEKTDDQRERDLLLERLTALEEQSRRRDEENAALRAQLEDEIKTSDQERAELHARLEQAQRLQVAAPQTTQPPRLYTKADLDAARAALDEEHNRAVSRLLDAGGRPARVNDAEPAADGEQHNRGGGGSGGASRGSH